MGKNINENVKKYYDDVIKDLKFALKQFREYTFFDKGPRKVMDIDEIINEAFTTLSIEEFRELLLKLNSYSSKGYGEIVVEFILSSLDDIEDSKWEFLMESEILRELY